MLSRLEWASPRMEHFRAYLRSAVVRVGPTASLGGLLLIRNRGNIC